MSRYFNIVLVSVVGLLSYKFGLGLSFYIPMVCYFAFKHSKNLILIGAFSFVYVLFFQKEIMVAYIVFFLSLVGYVFFRKNNKIYFDIMYALVINIITLMFFNINFSMPLFIIGMIITPIILLFFLINDQTHKNTAFKSFAYNEIIIGVILSIGGTNLSINSINLGLIVAIYFCMYFSSNQNYFSSIFFSVSLMFGLKYFFGVENTWMLPLISALYFIPYFYGSVVLLIMLGYSYLFIPYITKELIFCLLGLIIILELLRPFMIISRDENILVSNIYDKTLQYINNEITSFALFLDKIVKNIGEENYDKKISEGIKIIVRNNCDKCHLKKECFSKNKGKLYYYFKDLIINHKSEFSCPHLEDIKISSYSISRSITPCEYSDTLPNIINSVSNVLRQYTIDHSIKREIDYTTLVKLKISLHDYGYVVSLFSIEKVFNDDFLIEVGLVGIDFEKEQDHIQTIIDNILNEKTTIIYKKTIKNKTYFSVIPKLKYEVCYGYGSLAQMGNSICGDNYLVKPLESSKIIAMICDGMGKGINANIQSTSTLKLLDEITNTNITTDTALQILNTFYFIQDYREKYSTLDFIEINRQNGEALLYKAGATTTFIIHENGVCNKIVNENLPFGLEDIINSQKIKLQDNDLVIMASDGVFENVINEKDLEDYIKGIRYMEPQKIVYEILNYVRYADVISKDDMSVIALKLIANC